VGNGFSTRFWTDIWIGENSLRSRYPRLFSISDQKEAKVGEMGLMSELGTEWNFMWRRHLFMWEEEVLVNLKEDLGSVSLSNQEDVWVWKLDDSGAFMVNSAYLKLVGLVLDVVLWREEEKRVFDKLWKCPAPSKVTAFAWKAMLNRIPTMANLALRNVLGPEVRQTCALCDSVVESVTHLFVHCHVASAVWLKLMRWWDSFFIIPPNLFVHWECWNGVKASRRLKRERGWFGLQLSGLCGNQGMIKSLRMLMLRWMVLWKRLKCWPGNGLCVG
jgi:hypothetical protein